MMSDTPFNINASSRATCCVMDWRVSNQTWERGEAIDASITHLYDSKHNSDRFTCCWRDTDGVLIMPVTAWHPGTSVDQALYMFNIMQLKNPGIQFEYLLAHADNYSRTMIKVIETSSQQKVVLDCRSYAGIESHAIGTQIVFGINQFYDMLAHNVVSGGDEYNQDNGGYGVDFDQAAETA